MQITESTEPKPSKKARHYLRELHIRQHSRGILESLEGRIEKDGELSEAERDELLKLVRAMIEKLYTLFKQGVLS